MTETEIKVLWCETYNIQKQTVTEELEIFMLSKKS